MTKPKTNLKGYYGILFSVAEVGHYAELWWNDKTSPICRERVTERGNVLEKCNIAPVLWVK